MRFNDGGFLTMKKLALAFGQFLGILLLALLITPAPIHLFAQNRNAGEIRGTVTDPSGARVPDVTVAITNTLTGVKTQIQSGDTGVHDAPSLDPGEYSLTFTRQGFKK